MGVINVRVDEHIHDQLRELAEVKGVSLSEFVRDLLLDAVVPVADRSAEHGDQPAPESFELRDRLVLSLLHRILARVTPDDAAGSDGDGEYELEKAQVLEAGFTGQYWREVAGFETELSRSDSRRVVDVLEMFRMITFSIRNLEQAGQPVSADLERALRFRGFDHNDALEGHMARYVRFLTRDERHWTELLPQIEASDNGNSHMQMLDIYQRMLNEYRRIMDGRSRGHLERDYFLALDELVRLSEARVHPSHRGRL